MSTTTAPVTHTPGPWRVLQGSDDRDFIVAEASGNTVCEPNVAAYGDASEFDKTIRHISLAECKANAELIAAAPGLLAAIDEACEFLSDRMDVLDGDDGQPRPDKFMSLYSALDEVRAKARGERWPR